MDGHVNIGRDDKLGIVEDAGSKGRKRKRRSQSQEDAGAQVGCRGVSASLLSLTPCPATQGHAELLRLSGGATV